MRGIGTIVNVAAILAGSGIGMLLKGGMKKNYQDTIMQSLGIATIFVGITGVLEGMLVVVDGKMSVQGTLLLVLSLVGGGILGEFLDIEGKLERFGEWLKTVFHAEGNARFVEGFVTTSLIVCIGAMAIIGALEDGLNGDPNTLFVKSVLDFAIVIVFASALGSGCLFSAIPLALWEGGITAISAYIAPFLDDALISDLSFVGSALIFAIGINLLFDKGIKVGNLLPALLGPILYLIFSCG